MKLADTPGDELAVAITLALSAFVVFCALIPSWPVLP